MSVWSIGSVSTHCYNNVDSVPSAISGNVLTYADQARIYVETWTGDSVGSTAIAEKYQPSLIAFTMAELSRNLQIANGGVESASQEGLSATKNYGKQAEMWQQIGITHLKNLGKSAEYYKVLE